MQQQELLPTLEQWHPADLQAGCSSMVQPTQLCINKLQYLQVSKAELTALCCPADSQHSTVLSEQLYLNKLSHMELKDWAATLEKRWDGNMHILHPQALPDLGATPAPGQAQLSARVRLRRSMSCLAGHRSYDELQGYLRQGCTCSQCASHHCWPLA